MPSAKALQQEMIRRWFHHTGAGQLSDQSSRGVEWTLILFLL